ncbi:helix-turn-helix domain-containing protein [Flammeovirgaceae bacterium SG7u.111]|nr:helix-turn-helix domain-containing protein [Flammeovirgaceae bacterium SG7u.132]WPO37826.1 helix-turn-helix domain-containing protein [Flammeovirgaceae bacterium SG7u.111]
MMNENEKKVVKEALDRICSHRLFANSPTHTDLLKYLVEKEFNKEEVNEVIVGIDLYGIDYSENRSNSTVRSYMYKLRQKLAKYYDEEGRNEPIVFTIDKGQYHLSFLSADEYLKPNSKKESVTIPVRYLKLAGGVVCLAILIIYAGRTTGMKPSFIWEDYFETQAQNLLIISDQFMVYGKLGDGKRYGISYPEINSQGEYIKYTQDHPDDVLSPTDYTLMSKMAPYTVKSLSQWFQSNNNDFDLELESKLKYDDIQNHNIMFVGQYKTMSLSKSLFLQDSKVFTTFGDGFKYKKEGTEKVYDTKHGDPKKVEYAMVSYTSLTASKSALYFVSNNDIGVMATVRRFTDETWLADFQSQLKGQSKHFNALFEVSGMQRTDVSCKLVELEILK